MSTKKSAPQANTDVRIGIADSPQELNFQSELEVSAVRTLVEEALDKNQVLVLTDAKGRQVIIAHNKIAFVEIGESAERKVGFTSL